MLQNIIFMLAGTIYFFANRLAHRRRFVRWRNTVEYPNSYKTLRTVDIPQKELL